MDKIQYLKEWADSIEKNVWQREVFLEMKKENSDDEGVDALKMNQEKDKSLIDFIRKYVAKNSN